MYYYNYHKEFKTEDRKPANIKTEKVIDINLPVYSVNEDFEIPMGNYTLPTGETRKYKKVSKRTGRKKEAKTEYHWNHPMAFDIETTKYYFGGKNEERRAMFVWQFAVDEAYVIMGRTWSDFVVLIKKLTTFTEHFHIFVHNLTYETFFMAQILDANFNSVEVKLLKSMKIWEITVGNVHFHDSMVISGMSLEKTCWDYNYLYFKAKGDFDYDKQYTILTPLNKEEEGYCILDVMGLTEYINNLNAMYPQYTLVELPKTQTGFVRKEVLKMSREDRKYRAWFDKMALNINEYNQCRKAFEGGFTAGSADHYGEYIEGDIRCRDITSSYPFQLLAREYPINKFVHYEWEDLDGWDDYLSMIKERSVIATYYFTNVKLIDKSPRFSVHKCEEISGYKAYNGKLYTADFMIRTMTEVAFLDFIKYYTFDEIAVSNIMVSDKGKLPEFIFKANMKFFEGKSTLKGVEGAEIEYLKSKQMLNGIYGMSATEIVRDEWMLDTELMSCYKSNTTTPEEQLAKYFDSENSFMCYQWASYVTSYARHQVFEMMDICNTYGEQVEGGNWLYTDTDSVYYISNPEIEKAFEEYNNQLNREFQATTSKGTITTMGEVTPDGEYEQFVQYGAKKYCKVHNGELIITVAGVPKKAGSKVLSSIYDFHPGIVFKGEDTGKLRPAYYPSEIRKENVNGVITETASYINLMPVDYNLSGIDDVDVDDCIDSIFRHRRYLGLE